MKKIKYCFIGDIQLNSLEKYICSTTKYQSKFEHTTYTCPSWNVRKNEIGSKRLFYVENDHIRTNSPLMKRQFAKSSGIESGSIQTGIYDVFVLVGPPVRYWRTLWQNVKSLSLPAAICDQDTVFNTTPEQAFQDALINTMKQHNHNLLSLIRQTHPKAKIMVIPEPMLSENVLANPPSENVQQFLSHIEAKQMQYLIGLLETTAQAWLKAHFEAELILQPETTFNPRNLLTCKKFEISIPAGQPSSYLIMNDKYNKLIMDALIGNMIEKVETKSLKIKAKRKKRRSKKKTMA